MAAGMNKIQEGNYKTDIYIPENCNENTKIIVYYGNQADQQDVINELKTNGSDAIVVFGMHNNYDDMSGIINKVSQEYNISELNVTPIGFSIGSMHSATIMKNTIEENPGISPQVLVHLDGYSTPLPKIFKNSTQTLLDNNSVVITLYRGGNKYKHLNDYKNLAASGVNVLFLKYKGEDAKSHGHVTYEFFKNGNINFLTGSGQLSDMYEASIYDPSTGELKTIDFNNVNELHKVYDYFGIDTKDLMLKKIESLRKVSLQNLSVTSDSAYLSGPLNTVIGAIKTNTFINASSDSASGFSSTTGIPANVSEVTRAYFDGTIDLLSKIVNDIQEFAKIGPLMDKIDKELATKNLEEINAFQATEQQVVTPITNTLSENKEIINKKTEIPNISKLAVSGALGKQVLNQTNNKEQPEISNNVEKSEKTPKTNNTEIEKENYLSTENKQTIGNSYSTSSNKYSSSNNNYAAINKTDSNNALNSTEEFLDYDELYSDDTKIVYNSDDGYKIIIHKDGDKITGIEHYYDFKTENNANQSLNNFKNQYINNDNFESIIQKGRYVKIKFKEKMYENLTLSDIRNQYSNLNEVYKK